MSSQEFKQKSILVREREIWKTWQNAKDALEEELEESVTYEEALEHLCEAYTGWSA